MALFRQSWDQRRLCPENFNATTGEPLDQPDTEGFYTWGALMPLLGVAQMMDFSPWHGWQLVNDADDATLGPIESPIGRVAVIRQDGWLTLAQGGRIVLATNVVGAISHLVISAGLIAMELPPTSDADAVVTFPALDPALVVAACWAARRRRGGRRLGERRSPCPPMPIVVGSACIFCRSGDGVSLGYRKFRLSDRGRVAGGRQGAVQLGCLHQHGRVVEKLIGRQETGNRAIGSYSRDIYLADIALMRRLGVNAHRFSLSWPRILPGEAVNPAAIAHYRRFAEDLLAAGIPAGRHALSLGPSGGRWTRPAGGTIRR